MTGDFKKYLKKNEVELLEEKLGAANYANEDESNDESIDPDNDETILVQDSRPHEEEKYTKIGDNSTPRRSIFLASVKRSSNVEVNVTQTMAQMSIRNPNEVSIMPLNNEEMVEENQTFMETSDIEQMVILVDPISFPAHQIQQDLHIWLTVISKSLINLQRKQKSNLK